MGVVDLFSKRQKRARGDVPDVYVYDTMPKFLRVQILHIIDDAFGVDNYDCDNAKDAYEYVKEALCREYGMLELIKNPKSDKSSIFEFFLKEESNERTIDVV